MPSIIRRRGDLGRGAAPAHPVEGVAGAILRGAQALGLWGALLCATSAAAVELTLPEGAQQSHAEIVDPDAYALPTGPWDGHVPVRRVEGRVERLAFRLPGGDITVLQTLKPLRAQLELQGYEVLFECADRGCGGFDFRFDTEVLPAPAMHVNMSDFQFLSAEDAQTGRWVSLLVSRNSQARFVQLIRVVPSLDTGVVVSSSSAIGLVTAPSADLGARLVDLGHVVLEDLTFASGAAALGAGPFDSLGTLAEFLRGDRGRQIVLVGHTDAVGSLEGNVTLSQRRAAAVRDRLVERYGVDPAQLQAEGMGYLAPRATNLSEPGRIANRRVEVVLLP